MLTYDFLLAEQGELDTLDLRSLHSGMPELSSRLLHKYYTNLNISATSRLKLGLSIIKPNSRYGLLKCHLPRLQEAGHRAHQPHLQPSSMLPVRLKGHCFRRPEVLFSTSSFEKKYKIACPACRKTTITYDLRHLIISQT